ncbi:hypothetical protein Nepgr_015110 [Nepenthes gracilis]|uniref:Nuclear condensin complex subunit 3 C-terminal domain-containing protein n=1 Tax=Nepenthes gracilis TaxID=150966 RepID=A0AAD3SM08_NEPGR|nr:hypothetical protein Nepgr_015110 [Nepenthes gracilis]
MSKADIDQENQLLRKIAKILDESRNSYAVHNRKLKDLSNLRSSTSPKKFFSSFSKALAPLFNFPRRIASAERVIRFVATFTSSREPKDSSCCDLFLEEFLRFLLSAASAANKTARFRACQIISEIIIWLPDDAEVSNELWDDVIEHMKLRIVDKVPIIRTFAVRGLSRFVNDSENVDILELFLEALNLEQNADVRKTIVLSLPASNATSEAIIDCTRDVSESVRKATYFVLAKKFPLQSLSIKLRTVILQRGLSDRSPAVVEECLKLMKDEWLVNCCNNDPVELLKFLDVETYESIGDSVMRTLLRAGMVNLHDEERIHQFKGLVFSEAGDSEVCSPTIQLLEPEVALFWRAVCRHLQTEAQAKGSDAAATMGTKAAIYAAEASDKNDLLEKMLPATVSNYVQLVKAHLAAGPSYRFASRQLLLLGTMLDFSDATNWRIASYFVQDLLFRPPEYEMDSNQNMIVIGEDVNLVGDKDWAYAVSQLAKKVHAAAGEFEEVVLGLIEELARPCRERTADFIQWIHCLAVADLLLENSKSFHWLQGKAIEPVELLQSLFLPGAKHLNLDVQRVAVRCLGLYGLLEKQPGEELVKQLRLSFVKGPPPISLLAGKALTDLVMWHGPQEVDRALGHNFPSNDQYDGNHLNHVDLGDTDSDLNIGVLDLLHAGLVNDKWAKYGDIDENGSVQAVLGEGFAKILLLSENYSSIHYSLHFSVLAKLISLYFTDKNQELQRLKQCLSVFFEHYPSLSANHKKHLSRAFIPVVRAMWPGINGNPEGSPIMVSNMRPLVCQEAGNSSDDLSDSQGGSVEHPDEFESGEEGLGIRIATEVARFNTKKTSAEKSYASALCKCLVLLHFRSTEQRAIKLMRLLVNCMWDSISSEKELVKDLKHMAEHLKSLDTQPDQELLPDQADLIFGRLELDNPGVGNSMEVPPTPAPRSTRPTHQRRCVRHDETSSDEDFSPSSVVPPTVGLSSAHSQRASKTAAITKMTASRTAAVNHDIDEEEGSELTSEEESDESDYSTE